MIFQKSINKFIRIGFLPLILIHVIFLEYTRFTLWPEMVVYPYLINNGYLLYRDIINPYPPLLSVLLAVFGKTFGYLPQPYQLLTWVIAIIIDLSIFTVVYKIAKNFYYAFFALLFFVVFSIPFGVNGLWFDLVQTPIIIFSIFYFYKYSKFQKVSDLKKTFYLVTVAFFIKQQVLWLVIFYLAVLLVKNIKNLQNLIKNLLLPFTFFCTLFLLHILYFYKQGTLPDFVFWSFYQPLLRGASLPGYVFLPTLKQALILSIPYLIVVALTIFSKKKCIMLTLLALPLILFAYPRFDYFHLIPYLSLTAISFGVHIKNLKYFKIRQRIFLSGMFIVILVFTAHYFKENWLKQVRFFEQDILSTASFINMTTPNKSLIYIQNGPDQIYALASRLPIKPWADEFPWYLENGNLEQRVVNSLKSQRPKFIIFQPYSVGSLYSLGAYRPKVIADYLDENYQNYYQISKTLWLKKKI